MEFKLTVPLIPAEFSLHQRDPMLLTGSCFTGHIGERLARSGFRTVVNPHGILYDPCSIGRSLSEIVQGRVYTEADLQEREGLYFSFGHHGSFSDVSAAACLDRINRSIFDAHALLETSRLLVITLGTAFVYELADTGLPVANCHKLPAARFRKRLMTAEQVLQELGRVLDELPAELRVLLTVSPVRHWKDGAAENTRSKAVLITAVHTLCEQYANCHYFPAYELLMDDLRDYRFYDRDMVHPNAVAVDYIWERFSETYLDAEAREIALACEALHRSMEHRPLFPDSAAHHRFLAEREARLAEFRARYPFIPI